MECYGGSPGTDKLDKVFNGLQRTMVAASALVKVMETGWRGWGEESFVSACPVIGNK